MNAIKGKVLFIYPNSEGYGGVPNGIALLSGCLKQNGFDTKCFDTTFLNSPPLTLFQREKHGGMQKITEDLPWGKWSPELAAQIPMLLRNMIDEYKPDLIAVSHVDIGVHYLKNLLEIVKQQYAIPIIAGGITCTTSPELVIENKYIDIVCVGEGESAIVELANRVVNNQDYSDIKNLWVKRGSYVVKNDLRPLVDMDNLAFQDWSIFDERHYYKPYCGKFRRTGFFELARGCHFNCTYCCTAALRALYKGHGQFVRMRNIDKTFDEIVEIKDKYNLELVFFIDDNFLGMAQERFDYFRSEYKKRIDLPFYIQTRSETVKEEYVKQLKEINISTIGIGVEHGHEEFRKRHLNRKMSNESLQKAFDIIHKYEIRSTANLIIGMPHETEAMFYETVKLIRRLSPKSVSINWFQPYRGTRMRDMAIEQGLIPPNHVLNESNVCLDMPQFRADRIKYCYENFMKLVDGEIEIPKQYSEGG